MDITYRKAEKDDYAGLKKLYKDIFGFEMEQKNFVEYLENKNHTILIALFGEEICGSICIENIWDAFNNKSYYFLKNICTDKLLRKHGICTELFRMVIKMAERENINTIELTSANYRQDAHEFYLKHGFKKKKTTVFIYEIEYAGNS